MGDFNCTLNHLKDSTGYKSDPHPKSRKVLNGLLENEVFVDLFRHFNPDSSAYTYINKKGTLRGRLDYGLISPSLIPYVKKVTHTPHNYDVSDHASFSITLDITESQRGKGLFRCSPTIHKDPDYQKLIRNTIRKTIYDSIKKTPTSVVSNALFEARMKIEEEYNSLLTEVPNWSTQER